MADSVFVPNVITRKGDEKNDKFQIYARSNIPFVVFNRYGKEVFEVNADNPWNGAGASPGTYFYYALYQDCDGKRLTLKGMVHLLEW